MEQLPTETSSESCSLPPTPGKGSYDNDSSMEQFLSINDQDSLKEESTQEGGDVAPLNKIEPVTTVQSESPMFLLNNNGAMYMEFLEDQGREDNFTDLDLICSDGFIQVHRCLLMGASKFVRELLIDKDIMDTTAITLSDVSVRHLRQVLSILYSGRVLIDGCDEVEVFETMNLLGLPVENLLCRSAKVSDLDHTAALRHVASENEEENLRPDEEVQEEQTGTTESANTEGVATGTPKDEIADKEGTGSDDKVDDTVAVDPEEPLPVKDNRDGGEKDDHLPQITSTTGDSDSLTEIAPPTHSVGTPEQETNQKEYTIKAYPLNLDRSQESVTSKDQDESCDVEKDSARTNTNDETNVEHVSDAVGITNNQCSVASLSVSSDLDDLNFEEACNSLQMQVAKPMIENGTPVGGTGHEMTLRKRKINDNPESVNQVLNEENSTKQPKAANTKQVNNKKKKTPTKARKKAACSNGANSANENDDDNAELNADEQTIEQIPKGDSVNNPTSQKQRRVSNHSASSANESSTRTVAAEPLSPLTRVFLEVKEFSGVKYNIYGFMDPDKRVQSGKTLAIMASKDKNNKNSSLVKNN